MKYIRQSGRLPKFSSSNIFIPPEPHPFSIAVCLGLWCGCRRRQGERAPMSRSYTTSAVPEGYRPPYWETANLSAAPSRYTVARPGRASLARAGPCRPPGQLVTCGVSSRQRGRRGVDRTPAPAQPPLLQPVGRVPRAPSGESPAPPPAHPLPAAIRRRGARPPHHISAASSSMPSQAPEPAAAGAHSGTAYAHYGFAVSSVLIFAVSSTPLCSGGRALFVWQGPPAADDPRCAWALLCPELMEPARRPATGRVVLQWPAERRLADSGE